MRFLVLHYKITQLHNYKISLTPLISRPHPNLPKPRRTSPVPRPHHLLRLPLPAIRSPPKRPLLARTNRIHRIPKLRRDPRIRRILQHPHSLPFLDLPRNLTSKLKVVSLVVNRPRLIRLHVNAIIGGRNQFFQTEQFLPRQNADIRHPNHRQPVPPFPAHSSTRPLCLDRMRRLPRTQLPCKTSIRNDRSPLRRHPFIVISKRTHPQSAL